MALSKDYVKWVTAEAERLAHLWLEIVGVEPGTEGIAFEKVHALLVSTATRTLPYEIAPKLNAFGRMDGERSILLFVFDSALPLELLRLCANPTIINNPRTLLKKAPYRRAHSETLANSQLCVVALVRQSPWAGIFAREQTMRSIVDAAFEQCLVTPDFELSYGPHWANPAVQQAVQADAAAPRGLT